MQSFGSIAPPNQERYPVPATAWPAGCRDENRDSPLRLIQPIRLLAPYEQHLYSHVNTNAVSSVGAASKNMWLDLTEAPTSMSLLRSWSCFFMAQAIKISLLRSHQPHRLNRAQSRIAFFNVAAVRTGSWSRTTRSQSHQSAAAGPIPKRGSGRS